MHLFVLCPPFSGSTLIWQVLKSSPNVSALHKEGMRLGKSHYSTTKWWPASNRKIKVNWKGVKQIWDEIWEDKPIKLEKSPPHLLRAFELQENFNNPHFVLSIRDPYAFCVGFFRRRRGSLRSGAKLWLKAAISQEKNLKLKKNIFFTYEQFTQNPQYYKQVLLQFMPELESLDVDSDFSGSGNKLLPIRNLNHRYYGWLTPGRIKEINSIIMARPDLMELFSYKYR